MNRMNLVPDDFYGLRLSIIFPAEFSDKEEFRNLAEETICLNCPAHIHAETFWLGPELMKCFNELHEKWLNTKGTLGQYDRDAKAFPVEVEPVNPLLRAPKSICQASVVRLVTSTSTSTRRKT